MLFKLPKKIIKQINNRFFPSVHYLDELKKDLKQYNFYDDALMFKWAQDQYSTSKHLLTLYSIAHGLCAKHIVEIGFGRSSYVLAKAAYENSGIVYGCDNRSFGHLIPKNMVPSYKFTQLKSNEFWNRLDEEKIGVDMAFLDYFSVPSLDEAIILNEICTMLSFMKTNSVIAIHDTCDERYNVQFALQQLIATNNEIEMVRLPYNYGLGILVYRGPSKYGVISDQWLKKSEVN